MSSLPATEPVDFSTIYDSALKIVRLLKKIHKGSHPNYYSPVLLADEICSAIDSMMTFLHVYEKNNWLIPEDIVETQSLANDWFSYCVTGFEDRPVKPDFEEGLIARLEAGRARLLQADAKNTNQSPQHVDRSDEQKTKTPDGFHGIDLFYYAGVEVKFGKAAIRYNLLKALWDFKSNRPCLPRAVDEVINEVWGVNNTTDSNAFTRQVSSLRKSLNTANCPLEIVNNLGKIQLRCFDGK